VASISCAIVTSRQSKAPARTGARGDHAVPPCLTTDSGQLSRRSRTARAGALLIMGEPPRNDYAPRLLRDFTARLGSELHRTSIADRFHPGRPVAGDFRAVTLSVTAIARYSLAWQCSRESVGGAIRVLVWFARLGGQNWQYAILNDAIFRAGKDESYRWRKRSSHPRHRLRRASQN
jgi:hypothetical protein